MPIVKLLAMKIQGPAITQLQFQTCFKNPVVPVTTIIISVFFMNSVFVGSILLRNVSEKQHPCIYNNL